MVFDVTEPRAPRFVTYADNRDPAGDPEASLAGDLGPKGLHFVRAADSPNGAPLLLVGKRGQRHDDGLAGRRPRLTAPVPADPADPARRVWSRTTSTPAHRCRP